MIKLKVEPYCHTCNDFEAHVVKEYYCNHLYNTTVKCEHCERCAMLYKHIKEAEKNDIQRET